MDLAVEILKEIRDEARKTNERLDQTNERLDQTNERIDQTRLELSSRLANVEGTLLDLAEQQRFVVRYVKVLAERDSRLEASVADLCSRVEALEAKRDKPG